MKALQYPDKIVATGPDYKILTIIDALIEKGSIKNIREFCVKVEMPAQHIRDIKVDKRHFQLHTIENICSTFNVNANYIFGVSPIKFRRV